MGPKNRKADKDFVKKKAKVGRSKKQNKTSNVTNTSFVAKKVMIRNSTPGHSNDSSKVQALTHRNLSIGQLISRLDHHNPKSRRDALLGILELVQTNPLKVTSNSDNDLIFGAGIMQLLHRLLLMVQDISKSVREALRGCFRGLVEHIPDLFTKRTNVMDLFLSQIRTALTNIEMNIRIDAVLLLCVLQDSLKTAPDLFWTPGMTFLHLVSHVIDILKKQLDVHTSHSDGQKAPSKDIFLKTIRIAISFSYCMALKQASQKMNSYILSLTDIPRLLDQSETVGSSENPSETIDQNVFSLCCFAKDAIRSQISHMEDTGGDITGKTSDVVSGLLCIIQNSLKVWENGILEKNDKVIDLVIAVHEEMERLLKFPSLDAQVLLCQIVVQVHGLVEVDRKTELVLVNAVDTLCHLLRSKKLIREDEDSVIKVTIAFLSALEGEKTFHCIVKAVLDMKDEDFLSRIALLQFKIFSTFLYKQRFSQVDAIQPFFQRIPKLLHTLLRDAESFHDSEAVLIFISALVRNTNGPMEGINVLVSDAIVHFVSNHTAIPKDLHRIYRNIIYFSHSLPQGDLKLIMDFIMEETCHEYSIDLLETTFNALVRQISEKPQPICSLSDQAQFDQVSDLLSFGLSLLLKGSSEIIIAATNRLAAIPLSLRRIMLHYLIPALHDHLDSNPSLCMPLIILSNSLSKLSLLESLKRCWETNQSQLNNLRSDILKENPELLGDLRDYLESHPNEMQKSLLLPI